MRRDNTKYTAKGICKNILLSDYHVCVDEVTYYFTSEKDCKKFISKIYVNREENFIYYCKKYVSTKNFYLWSDLLLYESIEKRGFRVELKGVEYSCLKEIPFKREINSIKENQNTSYQNKTK